MRVIFCGTPEIAVPSLRSLAKIAEIVGVVCQPDRPSGRGMKLTPPAVKVEALKQGLLVYQPVKVRDGSLSKWMIERDADFALVIAYGRILTLETLQAPKRGCLNLHASILPEYRGAAPIQRALMDGRTETGVCLMKMDEGMDTGPVLACRTLAISELDNAGTLASRLGELAANITYEELPRFMNGDLLPQAQDHSRASYAPPLSKEDAILNFGLPALELVAQIRGLTPRPAASCFVDNHRSKRFKIHEASLFVGQAGLQAGQVGESEGELLIGTKDGAIIISAGQIEGKAVQNGPELLRGRALQVGQFLCGRES